MFTVDGDEQAPVTAPPYSISMTVPATPPATAPGPLTIVATATDNLGQTATDSVTVNRVRGKVPVVRITAPAPGTELVQGDTVTFTVETGDDSDVTAVAFVVDGQAAPLGRPNRFSYTYRVPPPPAVAVAPGSSSGPPHVFVGKATLNGASAPDGSVVVAFVAGQQVSTLEVRVTALNQAGLTGETSLALPVFAPPALAGESAVADGSYSINVSQPQGKSFSGKEVTFTINGVAAAQTGIWEQGGADVLDLTAGG